VWLRVEARVTHLQTELIYRRDTDTVPIAGTLGYVHLLTADGGQKGKLAINVLGDEYWDIFNAMLT
jgi:hypothetical protein